MPNESKFFLVLFSKKNKKKALLFEKRSKNFCSLCLSRGQCAPRILKGDRPARLDPCPVLPAPGGLGTQAAALRSAALGDRWTLTRLIGRRTGWRCSWTSTAH
jgi:hypothetical protein